MYSSIEHFALSNPLSILLNKPREEFTREDMMRVIKEKNIERFTFRYTALDGKIKEQKIPITSTFHAETILTEGERVLGTKLFPNLVDNDNSALYVVPVYKSAFLNPFVEGSLDFICRFITPNGELAQFTPDNILHNASKLFQKNTGMELYAMAELEFFLLSDRQDDRYPILPNDSCYHATAPYVKSGVVVNQILKYLSQITGYIKYAHQDGGYVNNIQSDSPEIHGKSGEQVEIELLPVPIEDLGDLIVLAKWVIRNVAYRSGYTASFAPNISDQLDFNSLHIQTQITKDGKSVMLDDKGNLSTESKMLIGGLIQYATSLTAFGNMSPASYLRLKPSNARSGAVVCWSDQPTSLIRVPKSWEKVSNLSKIVNPQQTTDLQKREQRQVVELRSPDGSANAHLLLAGISLAANWGLTHQQDAIDIAEMGCYIGGDTSYSSDFAELATSCAESSDRLLQNRHLYEKDKIFPLIVISYFAKILERENDRNLNKRLMDLNPEERIKEIHRIMHRDFHKH
jgi:glutamine synthetase